LLSEALRIEPYYEQFENNPYLESFYQEPAKWAFRSQLWFLAHVAEQQRQLVARGGGVQEHLVQDIFEVMTAELRASGAIAEGDHALLSHVTATLAGLSTLPDVLLYLDADPETVLHRIQVRGREMEQTISLGYLASIRRRYQAFVDGWTGCPAITVDTVIHDPRKEEGLGHVLSALPRLLTPSRTGECRQ
jgi:deoxyadenosine/deoxycytidine kinase